MPTSQSRLVIPRSYTFGHVWLQLLESSMKNRTNLGNFLVFS